MSGPYTSTFNALPIGTLNDDGYELNCTLTGQTVEETDAYGLTFVEGINRGQNWRCTIRGMEWNKTGLLALLQMFGNRVAGSLTPLLTNIGDKWTTYTFSMVLTATLANPPTTPQSLTAVDTGIAPNSEVTFNMTSKVREMPMQLVFIPTVQNIGGINYTIPFSTT